MLVVGDSTTWTAVGTSAFAALVVVLAILLLLRWRRTSARQLESVQETAARTEAWVMELTQSLDRVREESDTVRTRSERSEREARRLRALGEVGSTLDLDTVAHRTLDEVSTEAGADAAMLVLFPEGVEEPYTASYGLSSSESARELVGLPPNVSDARAVTIRYRYTAAEMENDVFRLTGGLAVPLVAGDARIGTLAVFWRRLERDPAEEDVAGLEESAGSFAAPLENARRYEEARRLADLDPVTGLQNGRYFADRLVREVARARRYERRVALLVFRFDVGPSPGAAALLGSVGRRIRSAVRSADVACHLDDGNFAVILPEVGVEEAQHLHGRLQFAVGKRLGAAESIELAAGVVELLPEDSTDSFLRRAQEALAASAGEATAQTAGSSG